MVRRLLSIAYILVGLTLGAIMYLNIDFTNGLVSYFKIGFYRQFGGIAIAVELIIAGIHLLVSHKKTNFVMALFGFTAVLDPIFSFLGILSSNVPVYGTIIFLCFAVISFRIAFSNEFDTEKISRVSVVISLILGVIIELFFNYYIF